MEASAGDSWMVGSSGEDDTLRVIYAVRFARDGCLNADTHLVLPQNEGQESGGHEQHE